MPVRIHVGPVSESWLHEESYLRDALKPSWLNRESTGRKRSTLVSARFKIEHRWGLQPLERFASSLALRGEPPEPSMPDVLDLDTIDEYGREVDDEDAKLPYMQLLGIGYEGLYLPIKPDRFETCCSSLPGVGSSVILLDELRSIGGYYLSRNGTVDDGERSRSVLHVPLCAYDVERSIWLVLHHACGLSVELDLPLWYETYFLPFPPDEPIGYREADYLGFGKIVDHSIMDNGKGLEVEFASGYRYSIPARYLLSWYAPGRWAEQPGIAAAELSSFEDGLTVTFSKGTQHSVGAFAILAGCEPYYEHFGGWTTEARANVEKWHRERGPFRIQPKLDTIPPMPPIASER